MPHGAYILVPVEVRSYARIHPRNQPEGNLASKRLFFMLFCWLVLAAVEVLTKQDHSCKQPGSKICCVPAKADCLCSCKCKCTSLGFLDAVGAGTLFVFLHQVTRRATQPRQ